MRALITGAGGFVGGYLQAELEQNGYQVTGLDIVETPHGIVADLLDKEAVFSVIKTHRPDVIFHLAGQASVSLSWTIPQKTIERNVVATLNLFEAVLELSPETKILLVGSSDEYGNMGQLGVSVSETLPLNPQTPYAVSKQAQENLAGIYARSRQLKVFMTRSFNHAGPGQKLGFMIPDFSHQIVQVERGLLTEVKVGNLTAKRDFTHVRDIVRAYRLIVELGQVGEIYNVGSGTVYSAQEILDKLIQCVDQPILVVQDPSKMRPSDTPVIRCNNEKLVDHTGWYPMIDVDHIVAEVLDEWRMKYQQL